MAYAQELADADRVVAHFLKQERVARALSVALIGDDKDWKQHMTHAKDFIEAMCSSLSEVK